MPEEIHIGRASFCCADKPGSVENSRESSELDVD